MAKTREEANKYRNEWRKERRAWLNSVKIETGCVDCGNNHPAVLDFHHRNPETVLVRVSELVSQNASKKRILTEINKCDVLCANCHRIRHWNEA